MVIAQTATVEIILLRAGSLKAQMGRNFPLHQNHEWEVVYYRTDFIDCPIGDDIFKSRPGLVLLTPPGIPHSEVALTDYSNYWLNLKVSGAPGWPRFCFDDREYNLECLFISIVQEWNGQALHREAMLELLLKQLELGLSRAFSAGKISVGEKIVTAAAWLIEQ